MSTTLANTLRGGSRALKRHLCRPGFIRQVSTAALQSSLLERLTTHKPNTIYDYLSPTPSHLLNISLADFLPESCCPPGFSAKDLTLPHVPVADGSAHASALPQGHHLIYFSPQVLSSKLLSDGTDPLQTPGDPFVRRMWAGGSLIFNNNQRDQPKLDNRRAYCREHIPDVMVKGPEGDEKVYVEIERQIGYCGTTLEDEASFDRGSHKLSTGDAQVNSPAIIETRNLVFMREKSAALIKEDITRHRKTLKPPRAADFSVSLVPSQSLLFRFSALTFNAHSIHLDPQYCREIEGHRNLLVHGPLTLILMLSALRSQLKHGERVKAFDYRNLAPLYANEQLKVCVRKDTAKIDKYEVWIEGRECGYAVKGGAIIEETQTKGS